MPKFRLVVRYLLLSMILPGAGQLSCGRSDGSDAGNAAVSRDVGWVRIDGGAFQMGAANGEGDQRPVHTVTVKTFEIARTEVTVAQYAKCVKAGKCTEPDMGNYCNWGKTDRSDHPVNCVDWKQASAYVKWIGGRLPTEAEWEFAARSGGLDRKYPWGDQPASCEFAVMSDGIDGCGRDSSWPVCSKPAGNTMQGLCDMAGNVWEWTLDSYRNSYLGAPSDGSARNDSIRLRVSRGGPWYWGPDYVRVTIRRGNSPDRRMSGLGLRPARSLP